jgi:hypothetical protein
MKYSSILAFLCLGLVSLSAHALTPPIIVTCPGPTLEQCKSPSYNASTCGKKAENIGKCKTLVDDDMQDKATLSKQIYEPSDVRESSLESGRAQGYYFSPVTASVVTPYARPGTPLLTPTQKLNLLAYQQASAADTWMGLEAAARLKAAQKSANVYGEMMPPQMWKRNAGWDSNDTNATQVPIASCEEFVYEGPGTATSAFWTRPTAAATTPRASRRSPTTSSSRTGRRPSLRATAWRRCSTSEGPRSPRASRR